MRKGSEQNPLVRLRTFSASQLASACSPPAASSASAAVMTPRAGSTNCRACGLASDSSRAMARAQSLRWWLLERQSICKKQTCRRKGSRTAHEAAYQGKPWHGRANPICPNIHKIWQRIPTTLEGASLRWAWRTHQNGPQAHRHRQRRPGQQAEESRRCLQQYAGHQAANAGNHQVRLHAGREGGRQQLQERRFQGDRRSGAIVTNRPGQKVQAA